MQPQIDVALVERLVSAQHPDLSAPVALLSHGWDNDIYRLGERYTVRLPRRIEAVPLIDNEQHWLPIIARQLSVPVPAPAAIGVPGCGYPWAWSICPWFDGAPAYTVGLAERGAIAEQLAHAILELHRPAPPDAPRNPVRGVPLADRDAAVRDRLTSFERALTVVWENALGAEPWSGQPVWLHGDLHPANVLVDLASADDASAESGGRMPRLAAIIDFGDLTAGDPATDIAAAWLFFDAAGRDLVRETLARGEAGTRGAPGSGGVDGATWQRARGWAVALATAFVTGSPADSPMVPLGHAAITELLADA
jgi:aminoglycoside phosphotransferase (APT) family kinase protein